MTGPQELRELAKTINKCGEQIDKREIEAARAICEAHKRIVRDKEFGDVGWQEWCRENITTLAESRIRELKRIGSAEDPKEELRKVRAQNSERAKKARQTLKDLHDGRKELIDLARDDSVPLKEIERVVDELRAAIDQPAAENDDEGPAITGLDKAA